MVTGQPVSQSAGKSSFYATILEVLRKINEVLGKTTHFLQAVHIPVNTLDGRFMGEGLGRVETLRRSEPLDREGQCTLSL